MQSVPQFKMENLTLHILSWITIDWAHTVQPLPTPPETPAGEWKSSVLNICPAFFLPMTPFNRQWRNVCNSENSGTVPCPRLFAQLWVHFLQLWPLPWADTVTCIRWGACIKEEERNTHEAPVKSLWDKKVDEASLVLPLVHLAWKEKENVFHEIMDGCWLRTEEITPPPQWAFPLIKIHYSIHCSKLLVNSSGLELEPIYKLCAQLKMPLNKPTNQWTMIIKQDNSQIVIVWSVARSFFLFVC